MSKAEGARRAAKIRRPCPDCHRMIRPSSMKSHRSSHILPWHLVDQSGDCWEWQGSVSGFGYGTHGSRYVHRLFYADARGPIPHGYQVDHLCRNRVCVRPSHLEAVSLAENVRRGAVSGRLNSQGRKTHCRYGHPFTPENTVQRATGGRRCRQCMAVNYTLGRMVAA